MSLEAQTPPRLCLLPGKSPSVLGLQLLGRHPSPIFLGHGTQTGPRAARRRGGLSPPSGFLRGRWHASVHCGHGDTPALWRGPRLQWRRNLVFQIFLDWSLCKKVICPTSLAGTLLALPCRLPRACPHTPGQPLSTPRRPQSWAPRASSQAGSPGPCRGVRVTQGPACPWCQLRGRGRATAPGPASQPSPPEPHAQVSPTRAPAQPLPLPRQAHAGTHTDPQTRGDAHAHGVTDTQTHACPQPPGRYFLIISHVASAIKFFN